MIRTEPLEGHLALVSFQRAEKRNALTRPIIDQLHHELRRLAAEPDVRGIVLAGDGPSFCAGVDLHEFADGTPDSGRLLIQALQHLFASVRHHPKPIACAIQGHCLGGGLELAACCDVRVSAPDAQLGMPEVLLGIPSVIDAVMLGHLVGVGRARELLLTGDSISGETAFAWGFVNRLAAGDHVVAAACELLVRITRHDPEVVAAQKKLHQQWLDLPYETAVEYSVESVVDAFRAGRPQRVAAARLQKSSNPS
ncbi:MAG TPA: enoyl-CoA hydratase-related protein [Chloroflexota bacterium]